MTRKVSDLKHRWKSESGQGSLIDIKEIVKRGGAKEEIVEICKKIPFAMDVPGWRDLRGVDELALADGVDFEGFDLSYSHITNVFNCNFDSCVFYRTKFFMNAHIRFRRARFNSASLKDAGFFGNDMRKADLSDSNCRGTNFDGSDLRECNFSRAVLVGANLRNCDLRGASFRGALLKLAAIHGAIIDKTTDLCGANLDGLWFDDQFDTSGAIFQKGVDWRQAAYDETTVLP